MIYKILFGLLLGGAVGTMLGWFGNCSTGGCPLTANPWRGALYGMVLGGLFAFSLGGSRSTTLEVDEQTLIRNRNDWEQKVRQSQGLVLVDYYSDYCPPCRKLAPTMENLVSRYGDRVGIYLVNVRKHPRLAREADISGTPTVVLYRDGRELTRLVGLYAPEDYETLLENYLPPATGDEHAPESPGAED